jgi:hypothetical protein
MKNSLLIIFLIYLSINAVARNSQQSEPPQADRKLTQQQNTEDDRLQIDEIDNSMGVDFGKANLSISTTKLSKKDDPSNSLLIINTKAKVTIPISAKLSKKGGGSLEAWTIDLSGRSTNLTSGSLGDTVKTSTVGINFNYLSATRSKEILYLAAGLGQKSDRNSSAKFNSYSLMAFASKPYSAVTQYFYGLSYLKSDINGGLPFPILGFKTQINEDLNFAMILPINLKLSYQANSKTELTLWVKPQFEILPVGVNSGGSTSTYVTTVTNFTLGTDLKYKMDKTWSLGLELGLARKGKASTKDEGSNLVTSETYDSGTYLGVNLYYLTF